MLVPQCDLGPCTASHCFHSAMYLFEISSHSCGCPFCHRLLADYRPSIGATKPHRPWAPVPPWSRCCWAHSVTWVPVPPPIAPTLPCATFRSPHAPAGFPFCHRLLYGLPLLLPPPPHCGSKHWFWPRDWPKE
ncbi:unnamed protein product [Staurois parvus]|uniref:Uncharacterized protein n=1 Tax=Staurois parvus TaxID=386267 RepID=A0ABN9B0P9_9NEOB|nr:unnamed protein product [Staurois parvus]